MTVALSVFGVALGTTIAYFAETCPSYRASMEAIGGALLLGGISLLGYALQAAIGVVP
jgi:hypothetical protein